MSPADRDEETRWDERLARTDAGELYGVSVGAEMRNLKKEGF